MMKAKRSRENENVAEMKADKRRQKASEIWRRGCAAIEKAREAVHRISVPGGNIIIIAREKHVSAAQHRSGKSGWR